MKNLAYALLLLCSTTTLADTVYDFPDVKYIVAIPEVVDDPRLKQLERAWNAGDQAATQSAIGREYPFVMAKLGSRVKGNLKVLKAIRTSFDPDKKFGTVMAKVEINGKPEIWYMDECKGDTSRFCNYHYRETMAYPYFGSAEQGQALDVASTAVGFGRGFVEGGIGGNEGLFFTIPFKVARLVYSHKTEDMMECISTRGPDAVVGNAAGLKNIALMAEMATPLTWALFAGAILYQHEDAMMEATFECAEFALAKET